MRRQLKKIYTKSKVYQFLLWVTNNKAQSHNEREFDIFFFIVNTIILIYGSWWLYSTHNGSFISLLALEYTWALDTLRNNRTYIK